MCPVAPHSKQGVLLSLSFIYITPSIVSVFRLFLIIVWMGMTLQKMLD